MIRDDKKDFHFVGFQEESAGKTDPQKSLVNLLYTWTEPLQDINQQNIIFEKTDILLTNDSLAPKQ